MSWTKGTGTYTPSSDLAPADTLRACPYCCNGEARFERTGRWFHDGGVGISPLCYIQSVAHPAASVGQMEYLGRTVEVLAAERDQLDAALTAERRARDELTEAAQAYSDVTLIQSASNPDVAAPTCAEHERLIDVLSRIRAARAGDAAKETR